jgi:hypothetical protein
VIENDEFIALVSALEQNTSLRHLDLRRNDRVSERAFLALVDSLPEIKTLQEFVFSDAQVLARPCLYCRQDCARTRAYFVSPLPVACLCWSHQQLKKRINALAAGCRKWNDWGTGTAFAL